MFEVRGENLQKQAVPRKLIYGEFRPAAGISIAVPASCSFTVSAYSCIGVVCSFGMYGHGRRYDIRSVAVTGRITSAHRSYDNFPLR